MNNHKKTHTSEKSHPCTVCDKKYKSLRGLKIHFETFHEQPDVQIAPQQIAESIGKPLSCQKCGKMFNMSHYLKQHQEKGLCERVFDCLLCKKKFNNSSALKLHERLTHESERPFSCKKCEKTFKTANKLSIHAA